MPDRDADFGFRSPAVGLLLLLPALIPSLGGWWLEFPDSWWSSDKAIACWTLLAPTLLVFPGFLWRRGCGRWKGAVGAFLLTATPFAAEVCRRSGGLDAEGFFMGVFVGLCGLGGFLLGMLLHALVRLVRSG